MGVAFGRFLILATLYIYNNIYIIYIFTFITALIFCTLLGLSNIPTFQFDNCKRKGLGNFSKIEFSICSSISFIEINILYLIIKSDNLHIRLLPAVYLCFFMRCDVHLRKKCQHDVLSSLSIAIQPITCGAFLTKEQLLVNRGNLNIYNTYCCRNLKFRFMHTKWWL